MRRAALLVAVAACVIAFAPPFWLGLLNTAGIGAVVAIGLVLLTGVGGMTSFGQASFLGFGAYAAAIVARAGWSPWLGLPAAVGASVVAAAVIGVAALRLSGHFLALATIAWAVALTFLAGGLDATGRYDGLSGIPVIPLPWPFAPDTLASPRAYAVLVWLCVALCAGGSIRLLKGRAGRALRSLRGGARAAASCGVDVPAARMMAFTVAAALAGLAGWLLAHDVRAVNPTPFGLTAGIVYLLMAVLGGIGHVGGAVVGALVVTVLDDRLQSALPHLLGPSVNADSVVFGALLVLLLQGAPGGLWPVLARSFPPARQVPPADRAAEPRAAAAAGTPLLDASGLRRAFGELVAVDDVSLHIGAGELVALIGPNGAGKSTLFDLLTGVSRPDRGRLSVNGIAFGRLTAPQAARLGIARTFQHARLVAGLTVRDNVALGAHRRGRAGALRAALGADGAEEAALAAIAVAALDRVGLRGEADRMATDLPLGRQRLVEIARALAADPRLLLLDEPAAGLRAGEKAELALLLARLRDEGLGIVLVEHDMGFVMGLADRLVVLSFGRVIARGTPDHVRADPAVIAAYLGTDS